MKIPRMEILFLIWFHETKNAFVLGGGSGHGFKHTPALGKLIAEVLSGKEKIPSLFLLNSKRN